MSGVPFAGWAIETLIATTLLMVAVLALRGSVRRAFGPDIAYALWALPLLRLVLPPLPQSWRDIAVAPVAAASETITIYVVEPLGGSAAAPIAQYPSLGLILVTLWALGAAVFLGFHALSHRRFCRRILARQVRGAEIEGGIHLIETDAATGPLAFGIVRKYVAFPRDFTERYDQGERDLALAHELGHHARGDLLANWVALFVLALHWFSPIAWRAFRAFRADQEIANDARVLAGMNPIARHTYACAIVKSAHGPILGSGAVSAACHLHTINDLKGRLKMLTTNKTSRTRLIGGVATVALLSLAGLGFTASGTQAAAAIRSNVGHTIGVDLTPPTPPIAPEAPSPNAAPEAPVAPLAPGQVDLPAPPAPPPAPKVWNEDGSYTVTGEPGGSITTSPDGKRINKRVKVIIRDKDGKIRSEDFAGMPDMKDIPEIREGNCPDTGNRRETVVHDKSGNKRIMIICTNRIEKMASEAADRAVNSVEIQRNAMQSALAGLRTARASIDGNQSMTAEQRAEALKGIDEAIKEVAEQMKDVN